MTNLVLPFFSKIYEKAMANLLVNFLDANGILSNFQFGFKHKHSTTDAIVTLTESLTLVTLYVVYLLILEKLLMLYPGFILLTY